MLEKVFKMTVEMNMNFRISLTMIGAWDLLSKIVLHGCIKLTSNGEFFL
jgi:hypothetical protein